MRRPTDLCLLCKINAAQKTNSHIFPKFLSKKFLGKNRKGFQISSTAPIGAPPRIVQDSPKDDHIFCSTCEEYFAVLETIACDTFTNWRYKCQKGDFQKHVIVEDVASIIECNTSNKRAIRLFIYSLFWRSSISENALFNNIKLSDKFEETLRQILFAYKSGGKNSFLDVLNKNPSFELFPLSIITAEYFTNETSNMLYVPVQAHKGVHKLLVDQFQFLLFEGVEIIPVAFFKMYTNIEIQDCKIILFSQDYWQQNVIQPSFNGIAEAIVENAKLLRH